MLQLSTATRRQSTANAALPCASICDRVLNTALARRARFFSIRFDILHGTTFIRRALTHTTKFRWTEALVQ